MREPITGLWVAGVAVTGGTWLLGIPVTIGIDIGSEDGEIDPVSGYMAIPVVGPWIGIAATEEEEFHAPLAVSGVLQSAGLVMVGLGVGIRREVEVPAALGEGRRTTATLTAAPTPIGRSGAGITVSLGVAQGIGCEPLTTSGRPVEPPCAAGP